MLYIPSRERPCRLGTIIGIWIQPFILAIGTVVWFVIAVFQSRSAFPHRNRRIETQVSFIAELLFAVKEMAYRYAWAGILRWKNRGQILSEPITEVIGMLASLSAESGGRVTDNMLLSERAIHAFFRGDSVRMRAALEVFRENSFAKIPFESCAKRFAQRFRHMPFMLETMYQVLLEIAVVDGISRGEEQCLGIAQRIFGLSDKHVAELRVYFTRAENFAQTSNQERRESQTEQELPPRQNNTRFDDTQYSPYKTLGCSQTDPLRVIKKRYRQLILRYHPDRFASDPSVTPELRRQAIERFRDIQQAYETILEQLEKNQSNV